MSIPTTFRERQAYSPQGNIYWDAVSSPQTAVIHLLRGLHWHLPQREVFTGDSHADGTPHAWPDS